MGTPRTPGTLGKVVAGTTPSRFRQPAPTRFRPAEVEEPTPVPMPGPGVDYRGIMTGILPSTIGGDFGNLTGAQAAAAAGEANLDDILQGYFENAFGNQGGTTGGGTSAASRVAQQKFEASKRGAQAQADYLRGLIGKGPSAGLISAIESQRRAGESYIGERAQNVLDELARRRTEATGVTGTAFDTLRNYLGANVPTAYAQAQRAVPQIAQTALGQYMSGQGVSPEAAQAAVQLANVQAAGGASNYNQLLNVLAAREAAAQASRLGETEMARAAAARGLESLYGAGALQVEQQRAAALADLANRIASSRIAAEQQAAARDRAIEDALGGLLGTGFVTQPVTPAAPGATPLEQLRALTVNAGVRNPALAQRVAQVSPQASLAEIQRLFPQLGARIRQ